MIGAVGEDASDGFAIADGEAAKFQRRSPVDARHPGIGRCSFALDIAKRRALTRPPERSLSLS